MLARALDGMCQRGELAAVLPGWYAPNELRAEPKILVTAIQRADPDSVIARTYHGRYYADFVAFLRRHTALEASGWRVLHFSADDLDRAGLRRRSARL